MGGDLWKRVKARQETVRTAYGEGESEATLGAGAGGVFTPLSGLIRREICGARISIQTSQRKKNGVVYPATGATVVGSTGLTAEYKFRKLGFIKYNGGLHVHSSLLNVLLHS